MAFNNADNATLTSDITASSSDNSQRLWPWLGVHVSYFSLIPILCIIGVITFHRFTGYGAGVQPHEDAPESLEERGHLSNAKDLANWKILTLITALMQGYIDCASLWFPTSWIVRLVQWQVEDKDWDFQLGRPYVAPGSIVAV